MESTHASLCVALLAVVLAVYVWITLGLRGFGSLCTGWTLVLQSFWNCLLWPLALKEPIINSRLPVMNTRGNCCDGSVRFLIARVFIF